MDIDSSPDEQEFPGLFEKAALKSKKAEENVENVDVDKKSKDKKSKEKKDRQSYEALGGESEEEEPESKLFRSPSKSKKLKTFKFPSTTKKREKSREPEAAKDATDGRSKDKKKEKKEKKEKKSKSGTLSSNPSKELFELGDIQPIFGVSLGLAVERSRCHDNVKLPLVVRECIDYLQEHGLSSEQIYRTEGVKTKIQHLRKSYNNRDSHGEEFDVPTACSLLKIYLQELPEPILTTELTTRFEEVGALAEVAQQAEELVLLIEQLPKCNQVLVAWLGRHFSAVIDNEKQNKLNAQSLAVLLSPILQMSHRLMITLLCHAETIFADVQLHKYVPPINASTSPNLPETPDEIQLELKKQESLLNQIHSEMNAGFVTKKREEELWETQRIITQLKRKLRTFEKKQDSIQKSMDADTIEEAIDFTLQTTTVVVVDENTKFIEAESRFDAKTPEDSKEISAAAPESDNNPDSANSDKLFVADNGFLMLPPDHPEHFNLIRLQLENQELMNWKQQLQTRINAERAECVKLKGLLANRPPSVNQDNQTTLTNDDAEYEKLVDHYIKENALLEQKRTLLASEIVNENLAVIQLQVELDMKKFVH